MPAPARSHCENRYKVCLVCFSKGVGTRKISGINLLRINNYYLENYNPEKDCNLPAGICARCRKNLLDIEQGKKTIDDLPEPYDFSKIKVSEMGTRANPNPLCACDMCEVARSNPIKLGLGKNYDTLVKPKRGRPSSGSAVSSDLPSPRPMKICKRCFQPVGRGVNHPNPCTVNDARENLVAAVQQVPRAADLVASDLIRDKSASDSSTIKIHTRGTDMTISNPTKCRKSLSKALFADVPVTAQAVGQFQSSLGLSLKQTERAMTFFRTWKGRSSVESAVIDTLRESDKDLTPFYTTAELELDSSIKGEGKVMRPVIYCRDLQGLVDHVIEHRGGQSGDYVIKIGIDGGGDFLKFTMNIIREDDESSPSGSKRSKYSDGPFARQFVESGVKKLLLIGLVQNVKESYENLDAILQILGIDRLDFIGAFDLKLANAFLGIGTHSSSFPCPWCEMPKTDFGQPDRTVVLRTLGSIRENAAKYQDALVRHKSKTKLSAAAFKSCQHPPLLKSMPDETLVLDVIPVMELHMVLGLTNRLYDHLDHILQEIDGCEISAKDWSDKLSIRRPQLHGGEFNGNQCKKLLSNIRVLEELIATVGANEDNEKIVKAFKSFNDVRQKCFGHELGSDYVDAILSFEKAYNDLHIPVTSKAHAVFDHVCDFLSRQTETRLCQKGLGFYSEQASESVHSDFQAMWNTGGYKRDLNHPDYTSKLLSCVVSYSS